MPIAARPSSSARATISPGCEAPRRKEKFVVTASSAYALIFHPPPAGEGEVGALLANSSHSHSRKQAVHEPARCRRLAPIKAFAEQPEAVAGGILDEIVVARRLGLAVPPPFGADAFRPLRAGDVVGHAAPAETPRRAVGNEGGDVLGRFGMGQQQERARFLLRL